MKRPRSGGDDPIRAAVARQNASPAFMRYLDDVMGGDFQRRNDMAPSIR